MPGETVLEVGCGTGRNLVAIGRRWAPCAREGGRTFVDFGNGTRLPAWSRRLLAGWLARFGVRHRPEAEAMLRGLAADGGEAAEIAGRYALLFRCRKRPEPPTA